MNISFCFLSLHRRTHMQGKEVLKRQKDSFSGRKVAEM